MILTRPAAGLGAFAADGEVLANGVRCGVPLTADAAGHCPAGFVKRLAPNWVPVDGGCAHLYDCVNAAGSSSFDASTQRSALAQKGLGLAALLALVGLDGYGKLAALAPVYLLVAGSSWPRNPDGSPLFRQIFYGGL